jgi:hypothetical protein
LHYGNLQLNSVVEELFSFGGYAAPDNKSRFDWTYYPGWC